MNLKKRNVLLVWTIILFLTVIALEIVYTPYDYAGFLTANNVGEGVAQANYPPIQGQYQVVFVTCEQWQFLFYPHEVGAPTVTVVLANEPVLFIVRSVDVTHGFYVNTEGNFATKGFQFGVMAVPGYIDYVTWNFQPASSTYVANQSIYNVMCSEYCGTTAHGLGHSWMDALIMVVNSTALQSQMLGGNPPAQLQQS
jgi:cytochrome c oxidase subunit 2